MQMVKIRHWLLLKMKIKLRVRWKTRSDSRMTWQSMNSIGKGQLNLLSNVGTGLALQEPPSMTYFISLSLIGIINLRLLICKYYRPLNK